jgi:hypothetical protein
MQAQAAEFSGYAGKLRCSNSFRLSALDRHALDSRAEVGRC